MENGKGKWKIFTVKKSISPRGRTEFLNEQNVSLEIQEGVVCHCERSEAIQSKLSGLPRRAMICPPRNDGIFVKICNIFLKNSKVFQKYADKNIVQIWLTQ